MESRTTAERELWRSRFDEAFDKRANHYATSLEWQLVMKSENLHDSGKSGREYLFEGVTSAINSKLIPILVRPTPAVVSEPVIRAEELAQIGWVSNAKQAYAKIALSSDPEVPSVVYIGYTAVEWSGSLKYGGDVRKGQHLIDERKHDNDGNPVKKEVRGFHAKRNKNRGAFGESLFVSLVAFPHSKGYDAPERRYHEALVSHFGEALLCDILAAMTGANTRAAYACMPLEAFDYCGGCTHSAFMEQPGDLGEFLEKPNDQQIKEHRRLQLAHNFQGFTPEQLEHRQNYREQNREHRHELDAARWANMSDAEKKAKAQKEKERLERQTDKEKEERKRRNAEAQRRSRERKRLRKAGLPEPGSDDENAMRAGFRGKKPTVISPSGKGNKGRLTKLPSTVTLPALPANRRSVSPTPQPKGGSAGSASKPKIFGFKAAATKPAATKAAATKAAATKPAATKAAATKPAATKAAATKAAASSSGMSLWDQLQAASSSSSASSSSRGKNVKDPIVVSEDNE